MKSVRRPVVALSATLALVIVQAAIDPTGLLALVGFSGAGVEVGSGAETLVPYLVFLPVLLGVVWWVAVRAGDRFWTLVAGVVLAVLLAQAAADLVMTWNLGVAAWGAGFATGKAIPAALIVAALTRWLGGKTQRSAIAQPWSWAPAVLLALLAPLLSGLWWTGAAYAPGVPIARFASGPISVVVAMILLAAATLVCLRWMRSRVPGVLGGWLAAVVAAGAVGLVQAIVAVVVDGGLDGSLWPLMAAYVMVADGLAFGACVGWVVGVCAIVVDRIRLRRPVRESSAVMAVVAGVAALGMIVALGLPSTVPAAAASTRAPAAALSAKFLRTTGDRITDGAGNQVLLRGVNVNQLVDFYRPRPNVPATRPLTEQDFADIAAVGFNVVRLNLSWSALEPTRGVLDPQYLAQISQAVDWAKLNGLYIVLDMHQDGWSKAATPKGTTCRAGTDPMWGYDGAPAWATVADGAPRCQFTGRDISPAGDRAFQSFYFNTDSIQSALIGAWAKLAERFAGDPTVAGYDLLNEPGFGEDAPVTTSYELGQFYGSAIKAIRAAGAPQIVFVEPSILWSGLGFDTGPTPGFTTDHNVVFSPHLYAESITLDRSLGIPSIVSLDRQFTLAKRVASEYAAPEWSGEYGYWGSDEDVLGRLKRYAADEDANLLGSAYWVWKQACGDPQNGIGPTGDGLMVEDCKTGGDGPPKTAVLAILGRAYPRSAPGTLGTLHADGAVIAMTGDTTTHSCGLDVWIPGTSMPVVHATGITELTTTAVQGGWNVTGCADGRYSLQTQS